MSNLQRKILLFYLLSINGVVNILLNGLVIYILVKTKQTNIPSMRILLYLSISSVFLSLMVNVSNITLLTTFAGKRNCAAEVAAQFFTNSFGHLLGFLIALMAIERFVNIKFMTSYNLIMSKSRTDKMVGFVVFLAFLVALSYAFGTLFNAYRIITYVVVPTDIILFVSSATVIPAMTTKIISSHQREASDPTMFGKLHRSVTSLTKKFVYTMIISYGLYFGLVISHVVMYAKASSNLRSGLEFMLILGIYIGLTNSVVNAVIFLAFNKKARRVITQLID